MALLSGSVEADVPIQFADREWSEFIWRSLYGSFSRELSGDASSINETDADSGTVKFETEGERLVKVSVELEYTPVGRRCRRRGGQGAGAPRPRSPEVPRLSFEALRAGELPDELGWPAPHAGRATAPLWFERARVAETLRQTARGTDRRAASRADA